MPFAHCCVLRPRQAVELSSLHILAAVATTCADVPVTVIPPAIPDTVTPFVPASDAKHEADADWQEVQYDEQIAAFAKKVGM